MLLSTEPLLHTEVVPQNCVLDADGQTHLVLRISSSLGITNKVQSILVTRQMCTPICR